MDENDDFAEDEDSPSKWPKVAEAWVNILSRGQPPILKRTQDELKQFEETIYEVPVRTIATIVENDPLMTLNLMMVVGRFNSSRPTEVETIEEALLMIGCVNFIKKAIRIDTVDALLAKRPEVLLGALRAVARARRAGIFAKDWAHIRNDRNEGAVMIASLLFDIVDVLAWVYAPEKMMEFEAVVKENPRRKIALSRWMEFGFEWDELETKLYKRWRLPTLVSDMIKPQRGQQSPSSKLVHLAAGFSRRLSENRDHKAMVRDLGELSVLLKMPIGKLLEHLKLENTPLAEAVRAAA